MKLYALQYHVDYEGSSLCGVYTTLELAEAAKSELASRTRPLGARDWLYISEVDANTTAETYKYDEPS